jgi:hypothetical protein
MRTLFFVGALFVGVPGWMLRGVTQAAEMKPSAGPDRWHAAAWRLPVNGG